MSASPVADARATAARVARESYGRLVAHLATRWRDVTAAEDALAGAFVIALERWPLSGIPRKPEAWLLTVARRRLLDSARGQAIRERDDLRARLADAEDSSRSEDGEFPDERIRLMLVCAHPAIDATVRPALILQTVLGLEVKQMAGAFLLPSDTLNKRLGRAKAKIKATGIRFTEPSPEDMSARVNVLLEAIYAAYCVGRQGTLIDGDSNDQLREEAVYLAEVVAASLPQSGEALGFRALLLFCEARRPAQLDADGRFVPLLKQDTRRWDAARMRTAFELLGRASTLSDRGPFQIEAAIHAAHCYRARSGTTPWQEIAALYQELVQSSPTVGSVVGMAIATAQAEHSPDKGLQILHSLDSGIIRDYQPYWITMSHLLAERHDFASAIEYLERGLGLTTNPALQLYLRDKLAALRTAKATSSGDTKSHCPFSSC